MMDDKVEAFRQFVVEEDTFTTLPGKSLCYAVLPFEFDILRARYDSPLIVIVCSPSIFLCDLYNHIHSARAVTSGICSHAQRAELDVLLSPDSTFAGGE